MCSHNMEPALLKLGLETEIRYNTRACTMKHFIEYTAPQTKNTFLPILGEKVIDRLADFCGTDVNGNFGVVRGGSMRSFLLDSCLGDHCVSQLFGNAETTNIGQDPHAHKVVEKVFAEPKDIDIALIYSGLNKKASANNFLVNTVSGCLSRMSFQELAVDESKTLFRRGTYSVELIKHDFEGQSMVKMNIFQNGKPALRFHFSLVDQEKNRDIRLFDLAADGDKNALGFLTRGVTRPDIHSRTFTNTFVRYFSLPHESYFAAQISRDFFLPFTNTFAPNQKQSFLQALTRNLREINFRTAYFSDLLLAPKPDKMLRLLLDSGPEIDSAFMNFFILNSMRYDHKESLLQDVRDWIDENSDSVFRNRILYDSDFYYGITVNPFIFFLFAFSSHSFSATPLREIFAKPQNVMQFLDTVAQSFGLSVVKDSLLDLSFGYLKHAAFNPNETGPFQLLKWLQSNGYLSYEIPLTVSSFLHVVNPLMLASRSFTPGEQMRPFKSV